MSAPSALRAPHGNDAGGVVLRWLAADQTTRAGRIHDALGVDRFTSRAATPSWSDAPVALEERPPRAPVERAGGLRCCGA
jgi:hypothetical protein